MAGREPFEADERSLRVGIGATLAASGLFAMPEETCRPLAEARQGPPARKRFTYWTLRRRGSAPVTHHGLDGFVTSPIADAGNARSSRPVAGLSAAWRWVK